MGNFIAPFLSRTILSSSESETKMCLPENVFEDIRGYRVVGGGGGTRARCAGCVCTMGAQKTGSRGARNAPARQEGGQKWSKTVVSGGSKIVVSGRARNVVRPVLPCGVLGLSLIHI